LEESRFKTLHHRSPVVAKCETPNPKIGTSTGVLDTRNWRSQELRLFITGVLELQNVKCQNIEIGTSTGVLDT